MRSCDYAYEDGAYVLGALPPAERAAYERHLTGCAACRKAVGEIAVLPGLLGRLDAAGIAQLAAPPHTASRLPGLLSAALATRRRERVVRRWRYAAAAFAAACLALVVGFGLASQAGTDRPAGTEVRMVEMQPVSGTVPVHAEIGLNGTSWGTEVTMRCTYRKTRNYARAYTFRLVALGPDGATEQVGSWVAAPGDEVAFTGPTRFSDAELVRLEVTRYDGTPLLVYDVP